MVNLSVLQGETGTHGLKGVRGEPGHKGDRGPLGLPVSTAGHSGYKAHPTSAWFAPIGLYTVHCSLPL